MCLLNAKKIQICMTECILIKDLVVSLSPGLCLSGGGVGSDLSEHTNFDSCQARVGDLE